MLIFTWAFHARTGYSTVVHRLRRRLHFRGFDGTPPALVPTKYMKNILSHSAMYGGLNESAHKLNHAASRHCKTSRNGFLSICCRFHAPDEIGKVTPRKNSSESFVMTTKTTKTAKTRPKRKQLKIVKDAWGSSLEAKGLRMFLLSRNKLNEIKCTIKALVLHIRRYICMRKFMDQASGKGP